MKKICIIKAGSAVVTRKDGTLDLNTIQNIGKEISVLIQNGWKPILVSSGASSAGKGFLELDKISPSIVKSLTASIGQSNLIAYYVQLLKIYSPMIQVAQLLISRRNLTNMSVFNSIRNNILSMLSNNILPIINENDVLWEQEINFSDNDHLASTLATMLNVDTVVLISDIDSIYTKNPKLYPDAKRISSLTQNYNEWSINIDDSNVSNGGMTSKLDVFKMMSILGINTYLLSKNKLDKGNSIFQTINNQSLNEGTHLLCKNKKNISDYKRWLLSSSSPKGIIIVSEKGALALSEKSELNYRTNLYCIGIENFFGTFNKGDIVSLRDENFNLIGLGKTSYSFSDLENNKCSRGKVFIHDNFLIKVENDFFVFKDKEFIEQYVKKMKKFEGYRIVQTKPYIIIDNQKKGKSAIDSYVDNIKLDSKKSSDVRYEAKQAFKKMKISTDDWIVFSLTGGKK